MTRVVVLVNNLHPYGGQRVAMTVAASMPPGTTPHLVLWDEPEQTTTWNGIEVTTIPRGGGGITGFLRQVRSLRSIVRTSDGVIAFMTYANLLALAATRLPGTHVPVVVTEHNVTSVKTKETERAPGAKVRLMRLLYGRAAAVVGVTDVVSRDLEQLLGWSTGSVVTVHDPVDVGGLRTRTAEPAPHQWFADPHKLVCVCAAALRPAKGQRRLLLALRHLPEEFCVVLVGEGEERAALEREADQLGVAARVHLAGWQDDPHPWVAHADVAVLPSRWEGFGLAAVEAAALGVPLVGSDAGGLGEVLHRVGGRVVVQEDRWEDEAFARTLAAEIEAATRAPAPAYDLGGFEPPVVAARLVELLSVSEAPPAPG